MFLAHELTGIALVHNLESHIGNWLAFLNEAQGVCARLSIINLHGGFKLNSEPAFMPDLLDSFVVEYHVDTVIVVIVVEVEQFYGALLLHVVVQACLRVVKLYLHGMGALGKTKQDYKKDPELFSHYNITKQMISKIPPRR